MVATAHKYKFIASPANTHGKKHVNQLCTPSPPNDIKMSYNLWQLQVAGDK